MEKIISLVVGGILLVTAPFVGSKNDINQDISSQQIANREVVEYVIQSGDTFTKVLGSFDVSYDQALTILSSSKEVFDFKVPIQGSTENSIIYENHKFSVGDVRFESIVLEFDSIHLSQEFAIGEEMKIDVNQDGFYDLYVRLNSINEGKAGLSIQNINEINSLKSEGLYLWTSSKMEKQDLVADDVISSGIQTGQVIAEEGKSYAEFGAVSFFVLSVLGAFSYVILKRKRYKEFGY